MAFGAKDAALGDTHKGTGDTHMASGLNFGSTKSVMGGGKAPAIKSNMKLDGDKVGASGGGASQLPKTTSSKTFGAKIGSMKAGGKKGGK